MLADSARSSPSSTDSRGFQPSIARIADKTTGAERSPDRRPGLRDLIAALVELSRGCLAHRVPP